MDYRPLSPFRRPMTHAHLRLVSAPDRPDDPRAVGKWDVLRDLSRAQARYGVTDRDLTVLQALLSFHPGPDLDGTTDMVVFASNRAICERLNGMPSSTMRRHLGQLVAAGLLIRRDSPNGKRYARRDGAERVAFGFDLTPLWTRADEFRQASDAVRAMEQRVRSLREEVSLMRRDLVALAELGEGMTPRLGLWDELRDAAVLTARALRRKLTVTDLGAMRDDLAGLLERGTTLIKAATAEDSGTSVVQNGQHIQNSEKESSVSEASKAVEVIADLTEFAEKPAMPAEGNRPPYDEPLALAQVLSACPSLQDFYPEDVRHWRDFVDVVGRLRPALGIDRSTWDAACRGMGVEQASVVVAAMLERFADIRSPGAYLRTLTARAMAGAFTCAPMVAALASRRRAA